MDEKDYVVMSKKEFILRFYRYLEPEQEGELLGGYYDGSTMTIHGLGQVYVEKNEVLVPRSLLEKL